MSVTTNSLNVTTSGLVRYNGAGVFSATTTTTNALQIGAASNSLSSLALTNGQLAIGSTGASPVAATLTPGTGIGISGGPGTVTISVAGSGLGWQSISANQTLVINNGYFVTSGALTLTLPAVSSIGDNIRVELTAGTSWSIAQTAGQSIRAGTNVTTVGVAGSLTSTASGDCISLRCNVANTGWIVESGFGSWTAV